MIQESEVKFKSAWHFSRNGMSVRVDRDTKYHIERITRTRILKDEQPGKSVTTYSRIDEKKEYNTLAEVLKLL